MVKARTKLVGASFRSLSLVRKYAFHWRGTIPWDPPPGNGDNVERVEFIEPWHDVDIDMDEPKHVDP